MNNHRSNLSRWLSNHWLQLGAVLLFAGGWFVIYFANAGVITGSLMLILGADILIAGLLAKNLGRAAHDEPENMPVKGDLWTHSF